MTAEELARFNERRRVAREESERQYLVELARIEALERMEGRLNVSVLCRVTKRLLYTERRILATNEKYLQILMWIDALEEPYDDME